MWPFNEIRSTEEKIREITDDGYKIKKIMYSWGTPGFSLIDRKGRCVAQTQHACDLYGYYKKSKLVDDSQMTKNKLEDIRINRLDSGEYEMFITARDPGDGSLLQQGGMAGLPDEVARKLGYDLNKGGEQIVYKYKQSG